MEQKEMQWDKWLESDMEKLEGEIERVRRSPFSVPKKEEEVVRESLRVFSPEGGEKKETGLPGYLENSPAEVKLEVEKLLDLAFHKGIEKAAVEAKKAGDFVVDAFHDALTKVLVPILRGKGVIK